MPTYRTLLEAKKAITENICNLNNVLTSIKSDAGFIIFAQEQALAQIEKYPPLFRQLDFPYALRNNVTIAKFAVGKDSLNFARCGVDAKAILSA